LNTPKKLVLKILACEQEQEQDGQWVDEGARGGTRVQKVGSGCTTQ
jgi:hypothetical protein